MGLALVGLRNCGGGCSHLHVKICISPNDKGMPNVVSNRF